MGSTERERQMEAFADAVSDVRFADSSRHYGDIMGDLCREAESLAADLDEVRRIAHRGYARGMRLSLHEGPAADEGLSVRLCRALRRLRDHGDMLS